jgi:ATP-binding cassette subfamily B protein RaxB
MWKFNLFKNRHCLPELFQSETSECGLACLVMIANYHNLDLTLTELRNRFSISLKGLTILDLISISSKLGLKANAVRCELPGLKKLECPALLHWDLQHFVVLKKVRKDSIEVHDPSRGYRNISFEDASNHFTGFAVQFTPFSSSEDSTSKIQRFKPTHLFRLVKGVRLDLVQVLALSIFVEVMLLMQPLFIRLIFEEKILFTVNGINTIVALVVINALAFSTVSYFRDKAAVIVGSNFNFESVKNVFSHILSINIPFFEKRSIGSLLERYRVMDEIETIVVSIIPFALLDGLMTVISLSLVFVISPLVALMFFGAFVFLLATKMLSYRYIKRLEKAHLHAKGRESGYVIETIQNIFTTKANNMEGRRFAVWSGMYSDLIDAQKSLSMADIVYRNFRLFVLGLTLALVMLILSRGILKRELDIAVVVAILFYFGHFTSRASAFIDRIYEVRRLGLRVERLGDIMLADTDLETKNSILDHLNSVGKGESDGVANIEQTLDNICVDDVSFKYGTFEPEIIKSCSFEIVRGESVALIGSNGAGKTTLLKILLGLYDPAQGNIYYNGIESRNLRGSDIRERVSVVMQNDSFFVGTVAQNISSFDTNIDMELVRSCAEIAGVLNDIESYPMAYNTSMGDMGVAFSAGQVQKIILARSLYRKPDFLFMDEGTANLDSESETALLKNLSLEPLGSLMIAHRQASIDMADRVLLLEDGTIRQI